MVYQVTREPANLSYALGHKLWVVEKRRCAQFPESGLEGRKMSLLLLAKLCNTDCQHYPDYEK